MLWTEEQYRDYCKRTGKDPEMLSKSPVANVDGSKGSKYHNKKTEQNGRVYASKKEAARASELELLVKAGEEVAVFEQVPFLLAGGIKYKADFVVLHWDGTYTVEDTKGYRTQEFKLKKRLMREKNIEIKEL